MKMILQAAVWCCALSTGPLWAQEYHTGLTELTIQDTREDRPLSGFIWYPTTAQDSARTHHTNAVWEGIDAIEDAEPATGKHPLVLLSHGMYGNAMNQSWLADRLAQNGYVVAALHHPGTSTWMRDPDHARQMWDRSGDITRAIDHALTDPAISPYIDPDRIYMAGHSLGGFTAVFLAGGRFDAAQFAGFCASGADPLVCGIFDRWKLAKTPEDQSRMQADLSDERIKGFAAFDLGGTQAFTKGSLSAISRPMLVIGAPLDIAGMNLELESRALQAALPESTVTYLEPAGLSHFDFLGLCKPAAIEILKSEEPGDEVICLDGSAERAKAHDIIADAVIAAFQ